MRRAAWALAALLLACRRDPAERALGDRPAAERAPAARFPAPNRPVSSIISPRWADEDSRDDAREADTVMTLLDIRPGTAVADVGAGDGYYTARLSPRVGAAGRVYAEDITPRYVEELRARVRRESLGNVTVVLGTPDDPRLPPAAVDVALLVHMYHEIEQPYALLHNLARAMRPGGRVAVLDLDRPTNRHGTPPALLECELARAGYRPLARHALAPGEYLAVFTAPPAGTVTPAGIAAAVRAAPCTAAR